MVVDDTDRQDKTTYFLIVSVVTDIVASSNRSPIMLMAVLASSVRGNEISTGTGPKLPPESR